MHKIIFYIKASFTNTISYNPNIPCFCYLLTRQSFFFLSLSEEVRLRRILMMFYSSCKAFSWFCTALSETLREEVERLKKATRQLSSVNQYPDNILIQQSVQNYYTHHQQLPHPSNQAQHLHSTPAQDSSDDKSCLSDPMDFMWQMDRSQVHLRMLFCKGKLYSSFVLFVSSCTLGNLLFIS